MRYVIDVRYWHLADIGECTAYVRYWGQSGHTFLHCTCPLMTQSRHLRAMECRIKLV